MPATWVPPPKPWAWRPPAVRRRWAAWSLSQPATWWLPSCCHPWCASCANKSRDLQRREADIAVRHVKPEQPDLIARLIREATAHFYASEDWVKLHGHPRSAEEAAHLPFVGSDRSGQFLGYLRQHGLPLTVANFSCYADHSVAHWALVREGLGIGVMMDEIAHDTPGIVRVLDDVPPVRFPIWLVTHRELRTSRRIRVVFDALAQGLLEPPLGKSADEPLPPVKP